MMCFIEERKEGQPPQPPKGYPKDNVETAVIGVLAVGSVITIVAWLATLGGWL